MKNFLWLYELEYSLIKLSSIYTGTMKRDMYFYISSSINIKILEKLPDATVKSLKEQLQNLKHSMKASHALRSCGMVSSQINLIQVSIMTADAPAPSSLGQQQP